MIVTAATAIRPLPPGTRLVHIGPHKTGTTAVQQALHRSRDLLVPRGVRYAGSGPQTYRQAIGLTGKRGQLGDAPPSEQDWVDLVSEARAAGPDRWVASSESFANAEADHVRRLASDLGPHLHVLRMVRRYDKLVTSQWQQSVAAGRPQTFGQYVETLEDPAAPFWRRHGFLALTERWAEGVGRDRLSVVVVDEGDRRWLLRVFEGLLGLEDGFLVLPPEDTNRSLTPAEVELLRRVNRLRVQQEWTGRAHLEFVRRGVAPALRGLEPDPQDGRLEVPAPLRTFLARRTREDLAGLDRLGVEVLGDPEWLVVPETGGGPEEEGESHPSLSLESASRAVRSVVDKHLSGVGFPLEGAGAAVPAPLPWGRRRRLLPGEQRLVAQLRDQGWPDAVVDRFVDRGLGRWLRRAGTGPGRDHGHGLAAQDRVDPCRFAVGLSGVIAQTDPAAASAQD